MLNGTNLADGIKESRAWLEATHAAIMPQLLAAHPSFFAGGGVGEGGSDDDVRWDGGIEGLRWARGMYVSRRFPLSLSREPADVAGDTSANEATVVLVESGEGGKSGDGGGGRELGKETHTGVMLPILDLPNHSPSTRYADTQMSMSEPA